MSVVRMQEIALSHPESQRLPHDAKFENGVGFVDGKFVTPEETVVPLADPGFQHADAAYETVTVSRGRIFRIEDHFRRFAGACAAFRLENPYSESEMLEMFAELLRLSGYKDAWIAWWVTRGTALPGGNTIRGRSNPDGYVNNFYARVTPYPSALDDDGRGVGLDLWISKQYIRIHPRSVDPTAKNTHWMDMKMSLFEARDHGKHWSVLTDLDGFLTEAPGANIFVVKDGVLSTPGVGCLFGITRQSALDIAESLGIPTRVAPITQQELLEADEVFLTTSAGGILPIRTVDDVVVGGRGTIGPIAEQLHNLYWERIWDGWKCTPVDYQLSSSGAATSTGTPER